MEKKFLDEGTQKTSMTIKRVKLLESIGFAWAKRKGEHSWNQKYNELRAYKKKKGDCNVATKFPDNPALGRWVSTQVSAGTLRLLLFVGLARCKFLSAMHILTTYSQLLFHAFPASASAPNIRSSSRETPST